MSAPRVPAWKRLGLKLKGPASGDGPIASTVGPNVGSKPSAPVSNAQQSRVNPSAASALKRKLASSNAQTSDAATAQTPNKKPRREEGTPGSAAANRDTPSTLKKTVSFADGTKDNAKKTDEPTKKKAKKKKKKKAKKKTKKKTKKTSEAPKSDFSLEPSLNYLRQWHTDRQSWKFNKNHQTLLIKYVFDGDKIPSSDINIFYEYIRDLKGFIRTRLRDAAAEIKRKDEEDGAGAFPESTKDRESKQKEYEETISRFLEQFQRHQKKEDGSSRSANGKRSLGETEFVIRTADPDVKQRLLKRIRAEMVLDELSDGESTATATTTTTTTATTSSASSSEKEATVVDRTRRSDGPQQPAKRRRLRNVRTNIGDDDSSSSESESSESESEDSSSSSDESSDEETRVAPGRNLAESSSSSSSSSSRSESESESESASESEEESGSEGSSSEDSEDDS